MASTKDYLEFILEQLSLLDGITTRRMMGEYLIYHRGVLIGGVYDDCFLVKNLPSALEMMRDAQQIVPYPGAKPMLLVDRLEDRGFLKALIEAAAEDLSKTRR